MKWLGRTLVVICVLALALTVGLRIVVGAIVSSDEFTSSLAHLIERGVHVVMPGAMVEIGETELSGLASLEIQNLTVKSAKRLEVLIAATRTRVSPNLLSMVKSGPLTLAVDSVLTGSGRAEAQIFVPKEAIFNKDQPAKLSVEGFLSQIEAPVAARLIFSESTSPSLSPTKGIAAVKVSLQMPFAPNTRLKGLTGSLEGQVDGLEVLVSAPGAQPRVLTAPSLKAVWILNGKQLVLNEPIKLREPAGEATISGGLRLSTVSGAEAAWDLEVAVLGDSGLSVQMAKALRCIQLPASSVFHVRGPVSKPACGP